MRAVLSLSLLVLAAFAAPANAADRGYCVQYANAAVTQYSMARTKYPQCAAGAVGLRWQPNFNAHYGWCLSADGAAAQREWDARSQYLYNCSRRKLYTY